MVLTLTTAASAVFRLASSIVLTRILAPDVFGAVGVITSIVTVLALLSDMGFYAFIVRHKDGDDRRFLDCVWTIRLIRSLVLAIIMALGAHGLAGLYGQPELATALMFSALIFLVEGVSSLGLITAARHERVAYVSLFDFVAFLLQTALTIALAYWLRSYWAILFGMILGGAIKSVATFVLIPGSARRFGYDHELAKELLTFSKYVVSSSALYLVLSQTDKIAFARLLTLNELGLLMLAATITQTLLALTQGYVVRVTYPRLARTYRVNPDGLSDELYNSRRIFTLLFVLAAGGIGGGADLIVRILFDERYLAVGFYLGILALAPAANLNAMFSEQTLVARGNIEATLQFNVVRIIYLAVVGGTAFYFAGAVGLLVAVATMDYAPMIVGWWLLGRLKILRLKEEALFCALFVVGWALGMAADRIALWLVSAGWLPAF